MRHLIYALLLLPSLAAAADHGPELERLSSALNMLNQQQQAVYQQFQMVQEVRRGSDRPPYGIPALSPFDGQIANYDEVVAAQRNAIQRREALSRQADDLLARYNEIETLKEPLRARIYALTLNPGTE